MALALQHNNNNTEVHINTILGHANDCLQYFEHKSKIIM